MQQGRSGRREGAWPIELGLVTMEWTGLDSRTRTD